MNPAHYLIADANEFPRRDNLQGKANTTMSLSATTAFWSATLIALAAIVFFWLGSANRDHVPRRGAWAILLMVLWAMVAMWSELRPTHMGHDISYIVDFFFYVAIRAAILGGIVVMSLLYLREGLVARVLQLLTVVSAAPRILLWWAPRSLGENYEDTASFVSLVGSFALFEVACFAQFRTLMQPSDPEPPDTGA